MASTTGPRYAPEDPTLPKPWRGLIDGKTGYLYFWNPQTNVTQYQRPTSSVEPEKPLPVPLSSSVEVQQRGNSPDNDNGEHGRGGDDESKFKAETVSNQSVKAATDHSQSVVNKTVSAGDGGSSARNSGSLGAGSGLSADDYRRKHEITVTGNEVPAPFTSFQETGFPSEILREVLSAGFAAPTAIQAQSWPIMLQNRDVVAVAKTGSGKTLGYLIPGFVHLRQRRNNPQMGPTILVLSPTRELATQIQAEASKFGKAARISCTCLYGGAPKGPQLRDLERGAEIVVATPGRLNDILQMRKVNLGQVSYLVLDEADRMLDMGFEPQIRKIVSEVPARRQTLMFTATWPKEVRKIAADLLNNPVQVNIGNVDELVANKSITQIVETVAPMQKQRRLEQILRSQEPGSRIIIFCSTKKMCDILARNLTNTFGAAAIHGDKSQDERDHVLSQFRTGRTPVLVATDVAARGLDVKDIRVVINFDFPTGIEDYVHRIGRTGRAGATGLAYTFLGEQDAKHAPNLVKILEGANQQVPPEVRELASRGGGMGGGFRRWSSDSGGGRGRSSSDFGGYGGGGSDSGGRGRSDFGGGRSGGGNSWSSSFGGNSDRGRSPSPKGGSGWSSQNRERDRSLDRHDSQPVRSFHQAMMDRGS